MGKQWKQCQTFGAAKWLQMVTAAMKLKDTPWKESYDQPRQQRHYFANKGSSSQGYGFSTSMYGRESWDCEESFKRRKIDAFELWCWRRLLRVPWTARRSNQSILKEISPGCSMEGLMLKLKLQYFGEELTHWKRPWCWEGLGAGEGADRGWDGWMASLTRWTWAWVNSGSWWWTGRPGVLRFMGPRRVGHDWRLGWAVKSKVPSSLTSAHHLWSHQHRVGGGAQKGNWSTEGSGCQPFLVPKLRHSEMHVVQVVSDSPIPSTKHF